MDAPGDFSCLLFLFAARSGLIAKRHFLSACWGGSVAVSLGGELFRLFCLFRLFRLFCLFRLYCLFCLFRLFRLYCLFRPYCLYCLFRRCCLFRLCCLFCLFVFPRACLFVFPLSFPALCPSGPVYKAAQREHVSSLGSQLIREESSPSSVELSRRRQ